MKYVVIGAGLYLVACATNAPPPAPRPAAVTVVSQEPDVAPEPQPASVVDGVERDAAAFGYLDADAFRRSALYRAAMTVVNAVPAVGAQLDEMTRSCGFNPVEAVSRASFSARVRRRDPDMDTAVLVVRANVSASQGLDCLERLVPKLERAEIAGHPALGVSDGYVVAREPFLVAGEAGAVQRALERLDRGARQRVPDPYLYLQLESAEAFEAERIVVGMAEGSSGTELDVEVRASSVDQAAEFEAEVLDLRRRALDELEASDLTPGAQRVARELLTSVRMERRGAELLGGFSFGSREREETIMGMAAGLAVYGVRRYMVRAKTAEARSAVWTISHKLISYAVEQKPPRFPPSAPRVPQRAPVGDRYQSTEQDWQQPGWKQLDYSRSLPQYYAFEFETARGGQKVTVRAIGDLDGDGTESRYEVDLKIERGQPTIDGDMREIDPLE